MWKNSGKFSGHTVDFVTRFSLASVYVWVPADVVFVVRFPWNGWGFFNEIVAGFVSRIVLQDDATCEFETRTRNGQHTFWQISSCLYRRTNLVKLEIGMQSDSRFISKIVVVWSKAIIATSILSRISKGLSYRLIICYLEFCQHRLQFISIYVNAKTSFQLVINKW